MTTNDLYRTQLAHLYTELLDPPTDGQAPRCMGFTEWVDNRAGRPVSLGWDWMRLDDGMLIESFECPIRTNILLLDDRGYDLQADKSEMLLREHIKSLPWKGEVMKALLADLDRANARGCAQPLFEESCLS